MKKNFMRSTSLGDRRSGKTFRAVLKALVAASEGGDVVFLSPTRCASDYAFEMAAKICIQTIQDFDLVQSSRKIRFEKGCVSFEFKPPPEKFAGRRPIFERDLL